METTVREPISLSQDGRGLIVSTGRVTYHVHSDEMSTTEKAVHQSLTEHGECVCLGCCKARVRNLLSQ
jgi:hypothetical protein